MPHFLLWVAGLVLAIILSAIWVIEEIRADRKDQASYHATTPKDRLPPA